MRSPSRSWHMHQCSLCPWNHGEARAMPAPASAVVRSTPSGWPQLYIIYIMRNAIWHSQAVLVVDQVFPPILGIQCSSADNSAPLRQRFWFARQTFLGRRKPSQKFLGASCLVEQSSALGSPGCAGFKCSHLARRVQPSSPQSALDLGLLRLNFLQILSIWGLEL